MERDSSEFKKWEHARLLNIIYDDGLLQAKMYAYNSAVETHTLQSAQINA